MKARTVGGIEQQEGEVRGRDGQLKEQAVEMLGVESKALGKKGSWMVDRQWEG